MNGVPHLPNSVRILHENILHEIQFLYKGVHISAEKCIRKIGKTYSCGGADKSYMSTFLYPILIMEEYVIEMIVFFLLNLFQ